MIVKYGKGESRDPCREDGGNPALGCFDLVKSFGESFGRVLSTHEDSHILVLAYIMLSSFYLVSYIRMQEAWNAVPSASSNDASNFVGCFRPLLPLLLRFAPRTLQHPPLDKRICGYAAVIVVHVSGLWLSSWTIQHFNNEPTSPILPCTKAITKFNNIQLNINK